MYLGVDANSGDGDEDEPQKPIIFCNWANRDVQGSPRLPSPPSAASQLQKGCGMLFKMFIPPLSSPSPGIVCVGYWAAVRWAAITRTWDLASRLLLKHTGWLTRIKPPWRLSFICCAKKNSLHSIQTSTRRLFFVWETGGLGSSVKALTRPLNVITVQAFASWTTKKDRDEVIGR